MQQAAYLSNGIIQAENLLLNDGDPEIIVEAHPEVCFRALNGEYLQYSKKTAAGVDERLSALEILDEYEEGDWRKIVRELQGENRGIGLDDVLDALVLALTACASEDEFHRLPADPPEDLEGLPMQMVYRSENEL